MRKSKCAAGVGRVQICCVHCPDETGSMAASSGQQLLHATIEHVLLYEEAAHTLSVSTWGDCIACNFPWRSTKASPAVLQTATSLCTAESQALVQECMRLHASLSKVSELKARTGDLCKTVEAMAAGSSQQ